MTLLPTGLDPSRRLWFLPWLILALGFGITVVLWQSARQDTAQRLNAEFEFWVDKVANSIDHRLSHHVQVLRGVVGLFDASGTVTRQEFRRYVEALKLEEHYPGIQSVGFSIFIPAQQKAAHEAAIRQEGFSDYVIRPPGVREFYTSVIYLEPFSDRNLRAFGYDMSPEPVRWAAATRARDEGQATLSAKVTLQQEAMTDIQPGFVIFMPIYHADASNDTLEERRANLLGWAFSPVRMHDFIRGVLQTINLNALRPILDVVIYDGVYLAPDARFFVLNPSTTVAPDPMFRAIRRLVLGGQPWSLQVTSAPEFEARLHGEKALLIALSGSIGSLLLALLIGVLTSSQQHIAAALQETAQTLIERQQVENWSGRGGT